MGRTLGFIYLAFGLKFFVTRQFTGSVFDGALGLIGSALDVFAIQV